jgi:hypothetical protein
MMDPSPNAEDSEDLIQQITAAMVELSWMSETDAPFDVMRWTDIPPSGLSREAVLNHARLSPEAPIEAISLGDFLAPVTQSQPWHTVEDAHRVKQFRGLQLLLEQTLTQLQVYRCGTVEIDIYVVGQAHDSRWLVLHTTAVET